MERGCASEDPTCLRTAPADVELHAFYDPELPTVANANLARWTVKADPDENGPLHCADQAVAFDACSDLLNAPEGCAAGHAFFVAALGVGEAQENAEEVEQG